MYFSIYQHIANYKPDIATKYAFWSKLGLWI